MKQLARLAAPLLLLTFSTPAIAQETETTTPATTATAAAPAVTVVAEPDAEQTRARFRELLDRHPPQVARVLKLDPRLFQNAEYLAAHPAIARFIAEHPEVPHSPGYYLDTIYVPGDQRPQTASERIWSDAIEFFAVIFGFSLAAGVLAWIIRTFVQHRRWSRLARLQADVHTKLMDRFGSNEDLLAYVQTPAGKRFLEASPFPLEEPPRPAAPAASRILWPLQIGLVLLCGGIGFQVVSAGADKDVAQPLFAMGVLALSVGTGFIVSAIASVVVSRKLASWMQPGTATD